jgi:tetratricopeptide (TPR) repeat protein
LPAEKKEALLSLLVNGLGSPYLLRFSWPEIRIEPEGNRILVNNTPLNTQGTLIVVRVGSEEEFRKAFKALRRVPALLVIYDATRGGFVQYQKWLYDLNYMLVKAIYEAAEHFGGPQFAEDLDFTFPLENFSDPLDILDFTNRYLEARGEGKKAREAKKEAFGQVLASKVVSLQEEDLTLLLKLVTKHTSQVITLHEVEGAEIEALQRLESAGFLILSGRKLMLTAPTLRLRDADFLEKAVLALEKKRGKALGESRKLYEDYLSIVRRPVLEPLPIAEEAAIAVETRFEVPLKEVEKELLKLEEKGIRSKALGLMWQAFASLKDNKAEEALADARLAYETDKELREAYLAFLAYGGEFCLANWRLDEAVEYFRRYEAEGGSSWRVFWGLGQAYHKLGKWERAESFYKQALIKTQEAGEQWGEGAILNDLGNVYADQGRWEEAIANYEKALEIFRTLGDRHGEAQTLTNLGIVYRLQGRWEEAIANYEKALETFRELGDRYGEAQRLNNLGNVYADQGRWEEAIACYEEALEIFRTLGDRHGEGQTLMNLGIVYAQQGRWEEAIACYEESLRIKRELGDRHGEAQTLTNLGNVYRLQGRWEEAIANYEKALEIFRALGDRHGEALALMNLGNVYQLQGRWEEAIANYEKALEIFRTLGDRQGEAQTLGNLANVYAQQGELEKALETAAQALRIFEELKAYPDLVTCHRQIASLSLEAGDLPTSSSHLAQALLLSLQLHPKLVLDTIDSIVSIAKSLASEGRFPDVTVLGSGLWKVVMEVGVERLRSEELKWAGMVAQGVCAVIALMGVSRLEKRPEERAKAREIALTMAKEIDEVTGGVWKLEEWVSGGD